MRDPQTGKRVILSNDFLCMMIKDVDTNETTLEFIEEPTIPYYIKRRDDGENWPKTSMPEDKLCRFVCKYSKRESEIAKSVGLADEFWTAVRSGFKQKKDFIQLYLMNNPKVYHGDVNIEDYYKHVHMEEHGRNVFQDFGRIRQGFMDIEVDQHNYHGTPCNSKNPRCPINSITFFDSVLNILFVLELDNQPDNPAVQEIKNDEVKFVNEFHDLAKLNIPIDVKILWYRTEKELLEGFWKIIHMSRLDFIGIWNMNFDIPYIEERMRLNDLDPAELASDPDVPEKFRHYAYHADPERTEKRFNGKGSRHPSRMFDWYEASSVTCFYDQMSLYSHIRKRRTLPSYKLDSIAEVETGFTKLDYRAINPTYNIRELAHQDFRVFLKYSMIDTIRLFQIEQVTGDLYRQIILTDNTRLSKLNKVSVVIKNKIYRFLYDKTPREIIGNNVTYPNYVEKFSGALVAKPDFIRLDGIKIGTSKDDPISTKRSYVFEHVVDLDFSSLYPSVFINFNIFKSTILGRIYEIRCGGKKHEAMPFAKQLMTPEHGILDIGSRYFDLPTFEQVSKDLNLT